MPCLTPPTWAFPVTIMIRVILLSISLTMLMAGAGIADMVSSLSADQLETLKSGEVLVSSKDMPTGGWPQVTVTTYVNAPVAVVENVFRDYDHAQDFQPGLVSAKVVSRDGPDVCDVEYTSKLPILGTTSYTVQNTFASSKDGLSVTWKLLKSSMADISDGSLQAENYGDGSILRYTNYVKPKSAIAVVAKGAALGEAKKTVAALKSEAEKRAGE